MLTRLAKYQKALTALVTGAIGWGAVVVASPSGPVTASEWLGLAVIAATALGVYAVPNTPPITPTPPPSSAPTPAPAPAAVAPVPAPMTPQTPPPAAPTP